MLAVMLSLLLGSVPCSGSGAGCTVRATIGSTELSVVVDSGADVIYISEAAARRAGITFDDRSPTVLIRGVNGVSTAYLARARVKVGEHEEKDVLVAIAPGADGSNALLGMSFLERFRFTIGDRALELEPVDEREEKRGGRGRSWWSIRFRKNQARLARYRALLPAARKADSEIEATYGSDPEGFTLKAMLERLEAFMEEEESELRAEAARHAVPIEWRQ